MFICQPQHLAISRAGAAYSVATALAACERRALDGGAVPFSGTMKCGGVKRAADAGRTNSARAQSRGRFFAFGALSNYHCTSEGAAVAGFVARAVTERSTVMPHCHAAVLPSPLPQSKPDNLTSAASSSCALEGTRRDYMLPSPHCAHSGQAGARLHQD